VNEPANHHPVAARVLVCEDQPEQATLLAEWLEQQRVQVTLAKGPDYAADALAHMHAAYAANAPFHLILADLRLGQESGLGVSLVRAVKAGFRATHIVLCSGDANLLSDAISVAGYAGVLLKPFNSSEIRRMLIMHRLPVPD